MDYFDCIKIRTLFNSEISELQNNCSCKINFNAELVELAFGFLVKTENEDHHYSFTVLRSQFTCNIPANATIVINFDGL